MKAKKILWTIVRFVFRFAGKLLLFGAWCVCELFSVIFTALAKWLKTKITR